MRLFSPQGGKIHVRKGCRVIDILEFKVEDEKFQRILKRADFASAEIRERVEEIIATVRKGGDAALCECSRKFDGVEITPENLLVTEEEYREAQNAVEADFLTTATLARVNIRRFHEYQRRVGYIHDDGDGVRLSKRVLPLKSAGLYCPAGSAPLFSTMLMCAIPAQIAGVERICACVSPGKDGKVNPYILSIAKMLDLGAVYKVGGAHAIAAMAYGTESIKAVDKIVGPGGPYVNMAKRLVFGACGIDSLAGPSEIVIVADKTASARFVAADLISQLEHGSGHESGVVLTDSRDLAAGIKIELEKQLKKLSRSEKIIAALERFGAVYLCKNLYEAIDAANLIAPEHLEIIAVDQDDLLGEVVNAGAVFLGGYSPEPVGDYFAGTNHVLPTAGAARFMSSLSVYDFVKDISVIRYTQERLLRTGRHIIRMAELEGLTAHANAIKVRLENQ